MANQEIDRTGQVFGDLTVIGPTPGVWTPKRWVVQCACGNRVERYGSNLVAGTNNCGCKKRSRLVDLTGKVFGTLTVTGRTPGEHPRPRWNVRCSCGVEKTVYGNHLVKGCVVSCGCQAKRLMSEAKLKHGFTGTKTYRIWNGMHTRCENPNAPDYPRYGGRGIKIWPEWHSFQAFLDDMGPCPEGYTIERKNNDDGYNPDNCIWIPADEQAKNRGSSRFIIYNGERMCVQDWSRRTGINRRTIIDRLNKGWPIEQVLNQSPVPIALLTHNGVTQPIGDWAKQLNTNVETLRMRLRRGWSVMETLTNPVEKME